MKLLSALLFTSLLFTSASWETNFKDAEIEASKNNKLILVNFSGSDWCLPCIRLKKDIFESESFITYASENLILVNADFPRQNKHKLSADQKKMNETLADKYNPEGKFPYTILLTADGKILKQWDGFPDLSGKQFVDEIKQTADANR
ncbi:MAG: thiol-disulfide isomerase [Chitinophagaceae bacterium]|nr:thiol-disulfide isomerase [Chitinophagaceae bacterium]MDB5222332.1 thiol-disulfide isomerase [Chitinophagaceae bacterium]